MVFQTMRLSSPEARQRLTSQDEFAEHIGLIEDWAIPTLIAKLILTFFDRQSQGTIDDREDLRITLAVRTLLGG